MAYGKAEEIIVVRKWKVEKYMEQIYVQTEDLSVGYHKKVLLSDIALKVNKGEILVLIGPNGAGKSTIIKNLIKEMSPIGGNIYIKGRKISDYTSKEYAKTMSVVLTEKIKTEMMTCRDVVAMGRYPYTNYFGRLTKEDIKNGLIFKQLMPDVEYNEIIADLRAKFIESRFACYQHEMVTKDGKVLEVVSFVNIQNKLLEGHRVLEVGMADITGYTKPVK